MTGLSPGVLCPRPRRDIGGALQNGAAARDALSRAAGLCVVPACCSGRSALGGAQGLKLTEWVEHSPPKPG